MRSAACILDWDLQVADSNRGARESCAQWNLGSGSAILESPPFSLPAPPRDVCAELKAGWLESLWRNSAAGAAERRRVRHLERFALSATIALHSNDASAMGKPGFLIEFERAEQPPGFSQKANIQAALDKLSEREREMVRLVCEARAIPIYTRGRALVSRLARVRPRCRGANAAHSSVNAVSRCALGFTPRAQ